MPQITLVFVHGWSVTNLNTYGKLPGRLLDEAEKFGFDIRVEEIFLGRYISFHDEVKLADISRAFNTALADQLPNVTEFVCITHSTGGPVIRDWWNRYCKEAVPKTKMSHLIMLAPANFGSALAQLGKGTLGRLKSWFSGVEPGQGVLDWLCLGSADAWKLNMLWITGKPYQDGPSGFYPFVLTGQSIDRKLYDTLNSYTGEIGSDGVVWVAGANLCSTYIRLEQAIPQKVNNVLVADQLTVDQHMSSPAAALRVITGKSHSGNKMGIMGSVYDNDPESLETIAAVFDCIKVNTADSYADTIMKFESETDAVQKMEKVETESGVFTEKRYFIHDRFCMIIFRITDSEGYPVTDFDLLLTAGEQNDSNHLPEGFFIDRQQNRNSKNTITYFLNYDILNGDDEVWDNAHEKLLRGKTSGIDMLGMNLVPRPDNGFVRYLPCGYEATKDLFDKALNPNSTTLIDIVLQRVVDKEVFRTESFKLEKEFSDIEPSGDMVE